MPIFGPRLDRPSAIGEEGRPSATSLGVAAVVVLALALAAGYVSGMLRLAGTIGTFTGLSVAGVALLQRDSIGPKVVGHLCLVPSGMIVVGLVVFASPSPPEMLLLGGFVVAVLGIGAGWANVADADALENTISQGMLSYAYTLAGLFLSGSVATLAIVGWQVITSISSRTNPGAALAILLVFLTGALGSLRLAIRIVPIVQLSDPPDREAVSDRLSTGARQLSAATAIGAVLAVVVGLSAKAIGASIGTTPLGAAIALLSGLASIPLAAVVVVTIFVTGLVYAARKITGEFTPAGRRRVSAGIAAVFFQLFAFVMVVPAIVSLGVFGLLGLVLAVLVGPVLIVVVIGVALVFMELSIVPDRAAGPAAAAAGLIVAAVGAGLLGLPAPIVLGCVAGGLVVWDAGIYGLGITTELGHRPETRRLELFHAVATVAIGAVGVAALTGLDMLRRGVAPPLGGEAAMAVAVAGVVLLLVPLRG